MILFEKKDIKLVSINDKYTICRGRLVLTNEYRYFKQYIVDNILFKHRFDPPYRIEITMHTHLDIDNCIKCIFDALEVDCIDNDKNIHKLTVNKYPLRKNQLSSLKIEIDV